MLRYSFDFVRKFGLIDWVISEYPDQKNLSDLTTFMIAMAVVAIFTITFWTIS